MKRIRYSLLRAQARCRYNDVRDSGKSVAVSASKPSAQPKTTSDQFDYLSFRSVQKDLDMHDGICLESSESWEKETVPSCVLDLTKCLSAFCSSSSACKVEKLIYVLCNEAFNPRMLAASVSSLQTTIRSQSQRGCRVFGRLNLKGI